MLKQITAMSCAVVTVAALEGFRPYVYEHVCFQCALSFEFSIAVFAEVVVNVLMSFHVILKITALSCTVVTMVALEGFRPCVYTHVCS